MCEDYCAKEGPIDKDRPVAGPCTMTLYDGKECKEDEVTKLDGVPLAVKFQFNEGCEPYTEGSNVTSHEAARCHNCCTSGAATLVGGPWNALLTLAISLLVMRSWN